MTDAVTNPIEYLKAHVTELAEQRQAVEEQADLTADLNKKLMEAEIWKAHLAAGNKLAEMRGELKATKAIVGETALNTFDGENKKPIDGIQITDTTTIEFLDDEKIVAWAAEHSHKSLTYKKADIKKIAKVMDVDGTEVVEGHGVRIASDLSAYLDD